MAPRQNRAHGSKPLGAANFRRTDHSVPAEDVTDRTAQIGDDIGGVRCMLFDCSVPGLHEIGRQPERPAGFYIGIAVADHHRLARCNFPLTHRLDEQAWTWLSAGADSAIARDGSLRMMRAAVYAGEIYSVTKKLAGHVRVDGRKVRFREEPLGNACLIAHHNDVDVGAGKQLQAL